MNLGFSTWLKRLKSYAWRSQSVLRFFLLGLGIVICSSSLMIGIHSLLGLPSLAQETGSSSQSIEALIPAPQPHPLPPALATWHDSTNQGDYFSEIEPTRLGYLVWSQFPIRVYIEPVLPGVGVDRAQDWVTAVTQAVEEWRAYLPLALVDSADTADISVWRTAPPLQIGDPSNSRNPSQRPLRARSAETRYQVYVDRPANAPAVLAHRFTILLRPGQTENYIKAAARHELGHAFGIWGHSLLETDVMYFSQVRNPPPISTRDINTLKRVYEQPTRLGWTLP